MVDGIVDGKPVRCCLASNPYPTDSNYNAIDITYVVIKGITNLLTPLEAIMGNLLSGWFRKY